MKETEQAVCKYTSVRQGHPQIPTRSQAERKQINILSHIPCLISDEMSHLENLIKSELERDVNQQQFFLFLCYSIFFCYSNTQSKQNFYLCAG